jgi:hypothetical protein
MVLAYLAAVLGSGVGDLQECNGDVRARVDESNEPRVLFTSTSSDAGTGNGITDSKVVREGKVGSVGSSLIPALDGGRNGIEDDGEVECLWMFPSVCRLVVQNQTILLGEVGDMIDTARILCCQSALLEEWHNVHHFIFSRKVLDILEKLVSGNTSQGIFDPVAVISMTGKLGGQASSTDSPVAFVVKSATLCLRRLSSAKMDCLRGGVLLGPEAFS